MNGYILKLIRQIDQALELGTFSKREKIIKKSNELFLEITNKPDEYEGTGMGLAICRKIVERHNGYISAHSQPGGGATFIVKLPVFQDKG